MLEHFIHSGSGAQEQAARAGSLHFLVGLNSGRFTLFFQSERPGSSSRTLRKGAPAHRVIALNQPGLLLHRPQHRSWSELGAAPSGSQEESGSLQKQRRRAVFEARGRALPRAGTTACVGGRSVGGWAGAGRSIPGGLPSAGVCRAKAGFAAGRCPGDKMLPRAAHRNADLPVIIIRKKFNGGGCN